MACSKRDDQIAMNRRQTASRHDQPAVRGARKCGNGALDLTGVSYSDGAQLHPERWRDGLDYGVLAGTGGYGGIAKNCRLLQLRNDLFEQLKPFRAHTVFEEGKTGDITARPRQTFDKPSTDRVDDIHEHNGHGAS